MLERLVHSEEMTFCLDAIGKRSLPIECGACFHSESLLSALLFYMHLDFVTTVRNVTVSFLPTGPIHTFE